MIGAGTTPSKIVAKAATALLAGVGLVAIAGTAHARVTRIVVDTQVTPAFNGASVGNAGPYETLAGRAFGELDPADPHNAIIQDIKLGAAQRATAWSSSTSIVLAGEAGRHVPSSSRLMWHDVPNRSGRDHHRAARARQRRHRPFQRLAGRQLRPRP